MEKLDPNILNKQNGYPEMLSLSQPLETSRQYLLPRTVILQKKIRWVPLRRIPRTVFLLFSYSGYFAFASCAIHRSKSLNFFLFFGFLKESANSSYLYAKTI